MIVYIIVIVMELISLGLVIAAGALWAGASLDIRPKYKDEQTLVAGTIWSQIIIPIGLLISMIIEEPLDDLVLGYFLLSGVILMFITSIGLISNECKRLRRLQAERLLNVPLTELPRNTIETAKAESKATTRSEGPPPNLERNYDRMYFGIGLLILLTATIKLVEFFIILIF